MADLIDRNAVIKIINDELEYSDNIYATSVCITIRRAVNDLPSAQPERKKMSNKEWVDFLSEQFNVSRTSAREMLHGLMKWKAEDNFKKQYSGGRNEKD